MRERRCQHRRQCAYLTLLISVSPDLMPDFPTPVTHVSVANERELCHHIVYKVSDQSVHYTRVQTWLLNHDCVEKCQPPKMHAPFNP